MGCTSSNTLNKAANPNQPNTIEKQLKPTLNTNASLQTAAPSVPSTPQSVLESIPSKENMKEVSLDTEPTLSPEPDDPSKPQRACFGAGCYWGTENFFKFDFANKYLFLGKIISGQVGFMGPENAPENPSYRQVCSGETGHAEIFDFEFTGGREYYEELVRYFFRFHDPTTLNRQGNDKGTQYASVIFCYNQDQFFIANKVKKELQQMINDKILPAGTYKESIVSTKIRMVTKFYPAHEEHQEYLHKNPNGYCNHRIRFRDWPLLSSTQQ